jgi:hypothetical protein
MRQAIPIHRIAALLLTIALAGCVRGATIHIHSGSSIRALVFELSEARRTTDPIRNLDQFAVYDGECSHSGPETPVWIVESVAPDGISPGPRLLSYGTPPPGTRATVGPMVLAPNHCYRAVVRGAGVRGSMWFSVSTNGTVQETASGA